MSTGSMYQMIILLIILIFSFPKVNVRNANHARATASISDCRRFQIETIEILWDGNEHTFIFHMIIHKSNFWKIVCTDWKQILFLAVTYFSINSFKFGNEIRNDIKYSCPGSRFLRGLPLNDVWSLRLLWSDYPKNIVHHKCKFRLFAEFRLFATTQKTPLLKSVNLQLNLLKSLLIISKQTKFKPIENSTSHMEAMWAHFAYKMVYCWIFA